MMNKNLIYISILVIALGAGASWVIQKAGSSFDLPIIKEVPEFQFINQNGEPFSESNLKGKISVLDFMFTSCPGPCPIMTNNMAGLYEDYINIPEVQFVSVTVDPEVDTETVLKSYADAHGVTDKRWQFLTSDIESIRKLKRDGFLLYAKELPQGHAIKFILIDEAGNIRKYYDGTDKASLEVLRNDLTQLVQHIRS